MPKPHAWLAGLAALTLASALAAKPAPAPDRALAEGAMISSSAETVGGWRRVYGSTYPKRRQTDLAVDETQECCFAVFDKGNAVIVVRTEAASRDAAGKPLTERIVRSKWITRKPSETITDCQLLWIAPQLSLYDSKSEAIRSVVIENGEFVIISWRDTGSSCSFGD